MKILRDGNSINRKLCHLDPEVCKRRKTLEIIKKIKKDKNSNVKFKAQSIVKLTVLMLKDIVKFIYLNNFNLIYPEFGF